MPRFEYLHEHINVQGEYEQAYIQDYPSEEVADYLNQRGEQGWELVNMTPHWEWDHDSVNQVHVYGDSLHEAQEFDVGAPYSIPSHISGWYCSFKRSID